MGTSYPYVRLLVFIHDNEDFAAEKWLKQSSYTQMGESNSIEGATSADTSDGS